MKRFIAVLVLSVLAAVVLVAMAIAGTAGGSTPSIGTFAVPLTVPKVASAACTTIVPGRATEATVSVTSTKMINWKAFTAADGAAVVVKRRLATGNTAYMPASSETNLPIEANASTLAFQRYTGANTITLCVDKN